MQMRPTEQPILEMVLAAIDQIAWKAEQNGQEICLEGAAETQGGDTSLKGQGSVFSIFLPKSQ